MRNPFGDVVIGFAAVLLFAGTAPSQTAQPTAQNRQNPPNLYQKINSDPSSGGPAPVHDFDGTWIGPGEGKLGTDIPPMTPAGQKRFKLNKPDPFSASSNDPWQTCDPFGMPRSANNETRGIAFATMPHRIIVLNQYEKVWREIWTDGRELPKNAGHKGGPDARWYGYSVGHWDADNALVVETVGMNDDSWSDRRGYPHSADARVEERYTRVDHSHLTLSETLNDPTYYTKPFAIATDTFRWIPGQDDASAPIPYADEQLCVPSEALEYMTLIGRPANQDQATGKAK
jgi:hypothetical protein